MRRVFVLVVALAASFTMAHAGTGFETGPCEPEGGAPMPGSSGVVRHVGPGQTYGTIQGAVTAASPGDTILVHPKVYNEAVVVQTPALRIRGTDRNSVILDGENDLPVGISVEGADRVLIENMTGRFYTEHAFFWEGATGWWGRYLTAYNNGLYGAFAFGSRCGQLDHSFASGNADSGFYIGQCFPCEAVITDVESTGNALGYSGTNAGGDLVLQNSWWHHNGLGIVPNSLDSEARPPQRGITIKHNRVTDNDDPLVPGVGIQGDYYGGGIVIAGGSGNIVTGNIVSGHSLAGIALTPLPDSNLWIPGGNTIWGNTISGPAGSIDLAQGALSGANNCWSDNTAATTAPEGLQTIWSCEFTATPPGGDPRVEGALIAGAAGLNARNPTPYWQWPAPTLDKASLADSDCDASGACAIEEWLPALF